MSALTKPFRLATEVDATQLAELVNFAGEGLPLHAWTTLAGPGENPWDVGRDRQAQKARECQIVVVDHGDGPVAALTGYGIGSNPEHIDPKMPAVFRPLQELENLALDSWYINVLACYPSLRGRGVGSSLLRLARELARLNGFDRLSVIVASDNLGARRFYERHGFVEIAEKACVKEGWETATDKWLLLETLLTER